MTRILRDRVTGFLTTIFISLKNSIKHCGKLFIFDFGEVFKSSTQNY